MKEIPIANSDRVALVDDEDYDKAIRLSWHLQEARAGLFYAKGRLNTKGITLHQFLFQDGQLRDHKDGNGLNCQRSNLRPCTLGQNAANVRKRKNTSSRFKGVTWNKTWNKWQAQIGHNRKVIQLGGFTSETDAAKAYNEAAARLFGEFALLNII